MTTRPGVPDVRWPRALSTQGARRQPRLLTRIYRSRLHYLFILPSVVLLLVFMYYPAFSALYHSTFSWDGFSAGTFVGLENFQTMLDDPIMQAAAVNVFKLTLFAMVVSVVVPLTVARVIFGLRSKRLQYMFRVLFVIPLVLPQVVILLIWKFLYDPNFGLLNQAIVSLHIGTPQAFLGDPKSALYSLMFINFPWVDGFALLIFTAGLQTIPSELRDAAAMDGAGPWKRFVRIELPLLMGQVKLILVLNMIWSIQNFTNVLILTQGGPGTSTTVPGLALYEQGFQNERMGYACAIGTAMFLVMLVLTFINLKYVRTHNEYEPKRAAA